METKSASGDGQGGAQPCPFSESCNQRVNTVRVAAGEFREPLMMWFLTGRKRMCKDNSIPKVMGERAPPGTADQRAQFLALCSTSSQIFTTELRHRVMAAVRPSRDRSMPLLQHCTWWRVSTAPSHHDFRHAQCTSRTSQQLQGKASPSHECRAELEGHRPASAHPQPPLRRGGGGASCREGKLRPGRRVR